MAKRRDMLEKMAKNKESGAVDGTLRHIRNLAIHLRGHQEITDSDGRVTKVVSTIEAAARLAGMPEVIFARIDVESGVAWSLNAELQEAIAPALVRLVGAIEAEHRLQREAREQAEQRQQAAKEASTKQKETSNV